MAGTINSLGLGSGVLTADIIDKLKANDVANIIAPIDRKITLQKQKDTALGLLNSLLSTFKTSASSLNDDALYQNRSVTGANGSVSVTASAGVAVQSFTISDVVLAKKHVIESGSFSASNSAVATGSGTMTLSIDGNSYGIDYTSLTTLEDLKAAINNKASDKVQASILQIGTNDYRLITTSKETGVTQSISMSDTGKLSEKIYKLNDTVSSAAFTSADTLVASGAVAQSTKFSLNQTLVDEGLSVTINGHVYSSAFNGTHAQTLQDFKDILEADNLFTATINGNDITLTAKTAGVPYTVNSPFSTSDSPAIASTAHLSNLTAQSDRFELNQSLIDGGLSVIINGTTYSAAFDTDHATTLSNFKNTLEVGGLFSVTIDGNNLTLASATAGVGYIIESPFTTTDSIATANTAHLTDNALQSDRFNLDQALTSEGLSVTIDGTEYTVAFNGTHEQTLADFKTALEVGGFNVGIDTNSLTISKNSSYDIGTAFTATDSSASASTTNLTDNVTPSGTYNVTMNGTTYNIAYDKDTTLTQLKDRINSAVGSNVASIKMEGAEFKLLLQSPTAGEDSTFTVSDTGGYLSTKLTTLAQNGSITAQSVQEARDATFKYNGISMTRSTNNIEDTTVNGVEKKNAIIIGVSIKLLNETEDANIVIAQDVNSISTEMTTMVQSYNTLMSQLNDMTTSNTQTGAVGIFNGDSSIKSISREISRLITSTNSSGLSLPNFGIDLNHNGIMSFNSKAFLSKFNSDPSATEAFLSGTTTVDSNDNIKTTDGIFSTLQNLLESYTETNGKLKTLTTETTNESKALSLSKTRSQALLDARYATMAARFSQYDSLISKLNSQFSSLQMQINAASNN
jgi:flagellar hook-associated protein 2